MILSLTAVYALKAVMYLAEAQGGTAQRADDVAEALGVPRNYLAKILHGLVRSGVLHSTRGRGGGFALALDPASLPLAQVIGPFDDIAHETRCFLGRGRCSDRTPCAAHARWRSVSDSVSGFLRDTTIRDLADSGASVEALP